MAAIAVGRLPAPAARVYHGRGAAVRAAFAAAGYFAGVVAAVPADGWGWPGLGEWSVRALVGHTVPVVESHVWRALSGWGTSRVT
jgi:hypothetical protein